MTKIASTDFLLPVWLRLGFESKEKYDMWCEFASNTYNSWYELERTARKIEYLTGYTLDDILEKVAAGYRLEFHKPQNIEFSETAKLADLVIGEGE